MTEVPSRPIDTFHYVSRSSLWFWWACATISSGFGGYIVFRWVQGLLGFTLIIPIEMMPVRIALTAGYGGIIGIAQALVLRRLLGMRTWWAISWVLGGALLPPLQWLINDLGLIAWIIIANLIQWRMLQGHTRHPGRWVRACTIALIASLCTVLAAILLFWFTENGDAPSSFSVDIAWLLGTIVYAIITGFGLTKVVDL